MEDIVLYVETLLEKNRIDVHPIFLERIVHELLEIAHPSFKFSVEFTEKTVIIEIDD